MAKTLKWKEGGIQVVGIHGEIRVASNHPQLGYELVYFCEPTTSRRCNNCKFKFKCFSDEEIQVIFRGDTIGIFPSKWKNAEPTEEELERYLFGRKRGLISLRRIPSSLDSIFRKR